MKIKRHSLKSQLKGLKQMREIFMDLCCNGLNCHKDCIFGPVMCDKLNHTAWDHKPYLANISLESLR